MNIKGLRGNGNFGVYRPFYPEFIDINNRCISYNARGFMCIGNIDTKKQCLTCKCYFTDINKLKNILDNER
jgi:hypothetical protein